MKLLYEANPFGISKDQKGFGVMVTLTFQPQKERCMKYIGMDAHSSICVFCVMDEHGVEVDEATIETNGRLLVEYVRSIEGKKKLVFEESELSQWLYELLHDEVDELIVCNPVANREYKKAKSDKLDARRLAKLLRGGFLTPVYHSGSARERFRSLMSGYQSLVEEATRLKNRYKSLFRKEGNNVKGKALYNDESLLEGFERSDFKFVGERTFELLQQMELQRLAYVKEIKRVSKGFKEVRWLKTIPGIADIQASKIVAQVIDPHRFPNKYKYYSYCGLARHGRSSAGKPCGSIKGHGNRALKCVYKMAAHSALRGDNGLRRYHDRLCAKGVNEGDAYNAVCRKIAAISLSLWKHERRYDDQLIDNPLK